MLLDHTPDTSSWDKKHLSSQVLTFFLFFAENRLQDVKRNSRQSFLKFLRARLDSSLLGNIKRPPGPGGASTHLTMFQPSLPLVNMAKLVMGTLLYGMYFIVFVTSMYLMLGHANRASGSNKYRPLLTSVVFITGCALFLSVTGVGACVSAAVSADI
jgi:hypothetical protein